MESSAAAPGAPFGYLARLQRAFAAGPAAPDPGSPTSLAADRPQLEVLRMLAAGRSNQAIARELVVTLDTFKSIWATFWANPARPTAPRA